MNLNEKLVNQDMSKSMEAELQGEIERLRADLAAAREEIARLKVELRDLICSDQCGRIYRDRCVQLSNEITAIPAARAEGKR